MSADFTDHPEPCFGRGSCRCWAVRASVRQNKAFAAITRGSVVKVQLLYKHYRSGLVLLLPTTDISLVGPVEDRLSLYFAP